MDIRARRLLALTEHEADMWASLQKGDKNISKLARETGFPRTTLYTAIESLKRRGLVTSRAKGRAVVVSAIDHGTISELFTKSALEFNDTGSVRIATNDDHYSGFTVIYGKDAMLNTWKRLANKKGERVYCIQPSRSLVSTIKRFKAGEFVPLNEAIKKNRVIMESIIREDNLSTYLDFHAAKPAVQKAIIKSFLGRMADTTLVGNEHLNNNADLLITSREAFLLNWEQEVVIEIRNRDMIELLKEFFELAKGYGKKIDFNRYMEGYLRRVG